MTVYYQTVSGTLTQTGSASPTVLEQPDVIWKDTDDVLWTDTDDVEFYSGAPNDRKNSGVLSLEGNLTYQARYATSTYSQSGAGAFSLAGDVSYSVNAAPSTYNKNASGALATSGDLSYNVGGPPSTFSRSGAGAVSFQGNLAYSTSAILTRHIRAVAGSIGLAGAGTRMAKFVRSVGGTLTISGNSKKESSIVTPLQSPRSYDEKEVRRFYEEACKQTGYQHGVGTPVGAIEPRWIKDMYLDSSGQAWYIATGTDAADWKKITS